MSVIPIILASQSPARLELLKRIKFSPDQVYPAHIDESELPKELPRFLVSRLAFEKASAIANKVDHGIIIGADTITVIGRKVLPKALTSDDIRICLKQLSGKRHRVYTGLCIIKKTKDQMQISKKLVQSIVKFKILTIADIELYCSLDEGVNKAGGFSISGYAESFVSFISGSYSNVMGLPLFETCNILRSIGAKHKI